MRTRFLLLAGLSLFVVAACTGTTPGWTYAPAPSPTPIPSSEPSTAPSASAGPSASAAPSDGGGGGGGGTVVEISAQNIAFDTTEITVPAGQPFKIHFVNNDAGIPHNVAIHEGSPTGAEVYKGEIFNGVAERTYDVPALDAGAYGFICSVHPNMAGTLTAE
jgi:plastocyanin